MKNFVAPGDNVEVIAPYDVLSGQGLLDGVEFSVAMNDIKSGAAGVGVTKGIFDLTMAAVTVVRKTVAYWDNAARKVTNAAGGNTKIGYFVNGAASGTASARVKLVPTV